VSNQDEAAPTVNPFVTRNVRPGALPFFFPDGETVERLIERLRNNDWWGQITGGHGSGKSALLAALAPALDRAGRTTMTVRLCDGQRRLPGDFRAACERCRAAIVIVDGYEQLGRLARFGLRRFCRRRKIGLVVTAHDSAGLPDLYTTTVDAALAWRIVARLQGEPARVTPEDVADLLARHRGDMRETLFGLYDLYEDCRAAN
jgi:hypothetical protein